MSFQGTTRTDPYERVYAYGSYEGADSVPSGSRFSSDDGTVPRMQAESGGTGERPVWMSVLQNTRFALSPVNTSR